MHKRTVLIEPDRTWANYIEHSLGSAIHSPIRGESVFYCFVHMNDCWRLKEKPLRTLVGGW
jgi:hypothetical protein